MPNNSFYRDASGRLKFEMFGMAGDSYRAVCSDLVEALDLVPVGGPVSDYASLVVGLEWDNWSGFIVVAKTPASEPLVRAIAEWLLNRK